LPLPLPMDLFQNLGHDIGFRLVNNWQLKFCWWPKRCHLSNQWIFFKKAYHGTAFLYNHKGPEGQSQVYWV